MSTHRLYCGIGSRSTPPDILTRMERCAIYLAGKGYTLRSGGASGADTAFEKGASNKEIFRPNDDLPLWTNIFTNHFHPSGGKMKQYVRNLMNRNSMQILGYDGNTPVEFVVCWTKDGKASGGTGQALRIATYFEIPIFNFYFDSCAEELINHVSSRAL